jgi:hypothetical protein
MVTDRNAHAPIDQQLASIPELDIWGTPEEQAAQMASESRAENAWLNHSENGDFYDDPRGA